MLISSRNKVLAGPTIISPVVTRFFWPPLMPLIMWLPTFVSAHTCHNSKGLLRAKDPLLTTKFESQCI